MPSPIPRVESPVVTTPQPANPIEVPKRATPTVHANTKEEAIPKAAKRETDVAEEPPLKRAKVKKRKKAAGPKDDIDAIFGKL